MENPPPEAAPDVSRRPTASTITCDAERAALVERANAGDPVAAIEVIRTAVPRESLEPPGVARVRLHPPERRMFRDVPRRVCDVEPGLCRLFGQLCAGERAWPLLLYGGVGSGKTMAALALADMLRVRVSYATLEELCGDVMEGGRPWKSHGDLLILDEVGERSKVGDLHYTTLKSVLDWREFHRRRVGLYISNLSPADLAALFDDRIVSRLTAGSVYRLSGGDRRQGS